MKGERSFHIFYQLVRGAGKDKALKAELKLPNKPSEFVYLSKSGCMVSTQDSSGFARLGPGRAAGQHIWLALNELADSI